MAQPQTGERRGHDNPSTLNIRLPSGTCRTSDRRAGDHRQQAAARLAQHQAWGDTRESRWC
jgi:hypothetical protein